MNETTTEVEETEEWKSLTPQDEETEIEPLRERMFLCYRNQGLRPARSRNHRYTRVIRMTGTTNRTALIVGA